MPDDRAGLGDVQDVDEPVRSLVCRVCGFELVGPVSLVLVGEECDNMCGPMVEDE